MKENRFLIFDFGASNGRAIVAGYNGKTFSMEVTHRFDNGPVTLAGTMYWDFLHLFSELKTGLRISAGKYPDITSLAVDTWGCDFGFIDGLGRLLANPVTYRNPKRHERSAKLYEILPKRELFELSAGSTIEIMGIYQIFSFKHEGATELEAADRFLMIPDLLNYFLTGRACNEYSNATMSLLCNQVERIWETRIFQRLGLAEKIFGEIVMPGSEIGPVGRDICAELAVPNVKVIAPATHDTASAVAGIPVTEKKRFWAFISIGTWCISGVETPSPVVNDAVFESGYGNNGTVDGGNMLVTYITGLWIIQQCRAKWMRDRGAAVSWDEIVSLAEKAKGRGAYIHVDDPVFGQPQSDMAGVIGDYCGKTGQKPPGDTGETARCVYESLALRFRHSLKTLEGAVGRRIELLHLVGGGTRNRLLCQWTSDAMGVPVIAGPVETTSVGNLLMQLKAAGEINGIEEGRRISLSSSSVSEYHPQDGARWDEAYAKYVDLFFRENR